MLNCTKEGVLTSYKVGDKTFASYVIGKSISEINNKISQRGLNENIESSIQHIEIIPDYKDLSPVEFLVNLPNIIHSACFMSLIALKAKTVNVEEILGDEGILHELIHINSKSIPISEPIIEEMKLGFIKLRERTVGVC